MPAFAATAPGKIILVGEHAVVYGYPAIAVPVSQLRCRVQIEPDIRGMAGKVGISAPDIGLESDLDLLPGDHPLAAVVNLTQEAAGVLRVPACRIRIGSTIPVASGLGSGAAVAVAMIRALAAFWGHPLPDEVVSALAFEVEKLHHGTPSGIDNSVITYERPVFFRKGSLIQFLHVGETFTIVIGDTGTIYPTARSVASVRQAWSAEKTRYESYFQEIAALVMQSRSLIEAGSIREMGGLLTANHDILRLIGVSTPMLDRLVEAALESGAWGAKLSGGGGGGNMICLVSADNAEPVSQALKSAGAVRTWISEVGMP